MPTARFGLLCSALLLAVCSACGPKVDADDTSDNPEAELVDACASSCARLGECGVPPDVELPPHWDCSEECINRWTPCAAESIDFIDCAGTLTCDQWQALILDPRTTNCSDPFEEAQQACGY